MMHDAMNADHAIAEMLKHRETEIADIVAVSRDHRATRVLVPGDAWASLSTLWPHHWL